MKKIFALALAALSSVSMFAAIDSQLTIFLDSDSKEVEARIAAGDTYSPFDAGACADYVPMYSNPSNIGLYVQYDGGSYMELNAPQLINVPLVIVTSREAAADQNYELFAEIGANHTTPVYVTDLRPDGGGAPVTFELNDLTDYSFTLKDEAAYVEGENSVIADRFIINYTYVIMKGDFNDPGNAWAYTSDFTLNQTTASLSLNLEANTDYYFQLEEGSIVNIAANGSEFDRDHNSYNVPATGWGSALKLHTDMAGTYTFTWTYATDLLAITFPTIVVKGALTSDGTDVVLTPAYDGSTATGTIDFAGQANDWYTFGVQLNGTTWIGDDAPFTRADNSRAISGDQNMWFQIEDGTVDYVYTFTWTFASNTLEIGYPTVAPVPTTSVTTNAYGFLSFASTESVEFLGGLKAYRGQYNAGTNELTLYEIGTQVPANTGVILWNSNGTAETFNYNTGVAAPAVSDNDFVGVTADADPAAIRATGKEIYCLNGNAMKQYVGTDNIPAGKAYLPISVGGSNNAPKHIIMRFNNTTAIENAEVEAVKAEKFIENGQIYIRRGNEVFNLQGQIVK